MYKRDQHLHFVGIGGVGMAGIAEVLIDLGYSVSGSDLKRNSLTDHLAERGVKVLMQHRAENVPAQTAAVIVSSAVPSTNVEVVAAVERGIPVIPRAEMLAELMRMKYGIAVAGSHGKTTTTSLVAHILTDGALDPTVVIGGRVLTRKTGAQVGQGEYLVCEADESDGTFGLLRPAIAVVTNIDREHLSHYGSFGALEEAFFNFVSSVPFYGLVVACGDDPVVQRMLPRVKRRVVTYGCSSDCLIRAEDIQIEGPVSSFNVIIEGREIERIVLPVPGNHMVMNALAGIAVGVELGVPLPAIFRALRTFAGVSRRTEVVSEGQGVLVIDDYAHHPTELRATLRAIRQGWLPLWSRRHGVKVPNRQPGRLLAVFQPHRYTRTRELFAEFLTAFDDVDQLFVTDVYSAGEEEISGISGETLAQAIHGRPVPAGATLDAAATRSVEYVGEVANGIERVIAEVLPGDIVVMLGAGSITSAAHQLADRFKEPADQDRQRTAEGTANTIAYS